eukprot:jgi/Tetstr1/438275/TSEL_026844.t1
MAPPVGGGGGGGGKRKPFRSISQVLDTPVTPELLAALPAPVQQTNLMMGPKMSQAAAPIDPNLVSAAMARFTEEAAILVVAQDQATFDLFHQIVSQLPMKVKLRQATGKAGLIAELNTAAKSIVEGSGQQFDLVLCDPEIVKQDGQLVVTVHSKYSVPIALFSSTEEAIHTHVVDDWLGLRRGPVDPMQMAARILKWNAKSNGKPVPNLHVECGAQGSARGWQHGGGNGNAMMAEQAQQMMCQPMRSNGSATIQMGDQQLQQMQQMMGMPSQQTQGSSQAGDGSRQPQGMPMMGIPPPQQQQPPPSTSQPSQMGMATQSMYPSQTGVGMSIGMQMPPPPMRMHGMPQSGGGALPQHGANPGFEQLLAMLMNEAEALRLELSAKRKQLQEAASTSYKGGVPTEPQVQGLSTPAGRDLGAQLLQELASLTEEKARKEAQKRRAEEAAAAKIAAAEAEAQARRSAEEARRREAAAAREAEEAAQRAAAEAARQKAERERQEEARIASLSPAQRRQNAYNLESFPFPCVED